jgi:hypothetical protein
MVGRFFCKTLFSFLCCFSPLLNAVETSPPYSKSLTTDPAPYFLPIHHSLRPILDSIFSRGNALQNEKTFYEAGFETVCVKHSSGIRLAKHPLVKGYLFKIYLDSDVHHRGIRDNWSKQDCLIQRCMGAAKIRTLINSSHLQCFSVPDKWLYGISFNTAERVNQSLVLVETDMRVLNKKKSLKAWKTRVTKKHLEELLIILKNGCGSGGLAINVPYTKSGTFAFIDTEYPERVFDLPQEKKFFSQEMQAYWDFLLLRNK